MKSIEYVRVFLFGFLILLCVSFVQSAPNGASSTASTPETAPADNSSNASAFAGNITELIITGFATTQTWQGYYGNVTGAIRLSDSGGSNLYNWTLAEPAGEVYASMNNSIVWTNIQCFNFTANGTLGTSGETAGGTSLSGINLTTLETRFAIATADVDGVNETFSLSPGGDGHDAFFTGNLQFSTGECQSTKVFSDTGVETNNFEEALLWEPASGSVVFASLLEVGAQAGFDTGDHDFEMLVLEDGHDGNTASTPYFFFVELE